MKLFKNKGSFSLELIAIVVCVILVAVLALRTFGGQISNTINDSTNTVESVTSNVLNQYGSGGSGSGGSGGSGGTGSDDPTSTVDMSNINVVDGTTTLAAGDFSTKGNLVTINDTQYRVLAVNGTQAKVMSMESAGDSKFNSSSVTISFGSYTGQKYEGYTLDQAMITYYDALPNVIQNAIVEQNINQSMYSWNIGTNSSASFSAWYSNDFTTSTSSGTNYYLTRIADINVGVRKVYALDVDDVLAYLGSSSTPQDVNELFWNQRSSKSNYVWLRSANSNNSGYAFRVAGYGGDLSGNFYSNSFEVRPAFIIDLSLLG